jgi:hypothetical protein
LQELPERFWSQLRHYDITGCHDGSNQCDAQEWRPQCRGAKVPNAPRVHGCKVAF